MTLFTPYPPNPRQHRLCLSIKTNGMSFRGRRPRNLPGREILSAMKNNPHPLHSHLARLGRRLRWRDGLHLALSTLWSALLLSALIELAARFWPLPDRHLWATAPLEIWLLGIILYTLIRPLPLAQTARRLDQELYLKDRLSTALELEAWKTGSMEDRKHGRLEEKSSQPPAFQPSSLPTLNPSNLPTLQLSDALSVIQSLTPADLPWRVPRRPLWFTGGLLALLLALTWLPNPMDDLLVRRAAIQEAAQQQAEAIKEAQRELEKSTDPTSEERTEALRALAELMKELVANPGDLEQALADLAAAQAKLRQLQDPQAAARQSAAEQIAEQLTALARGETHKSADPGQAAAALTELAAALNSLNSASQTGLAQALEGMAAQAAATDAELAESLLDLAEAVRAGDLGEALQVANAVQGALARSTQAGNLQAALAAAQARLEASRQQMAQQGALAQGQGRGQGQQVGGGGGSNANQLPGANRTGVARDPTQPNKPASLPDLDTVYAPGGGQQMVGDPEFVAGQETDAGQTIIRQEQSSQSGAANPSLVPYREVYQNYADAAAEVVEQERISPEMRDLVRDYFSQLAPE